MTLRNHANAATWALATRRNTTKGDKQMYRQPRLARIARHLTGIGLPVRAMTVVPAVRGGGLQTATGGCGIEKHGRGAAGRVRTGVTDVPRPKTRRVATKTTLHPHCDSRQHASATGAGWEPLVAARIAKTLLDDVLTWGHSRASAAVSDVSSAARDEARRNGHAIFANA